MDLSELMQGYVDAPHPPMPGAVAGILHDGRLVDSAVLGHTRRYADRAGTLLPAGEQEAVTADTLYDLASLTKLFATVTLLRLVDRELLDLDAPLAAWLPSYAHGERAQVTLRQLLTHTAGLPAITELWTLDGTRGDRLLQLLGIPLEAVPGSRFTYSCVGYMTAMALAEVRTSTRFDELMAAEVLQPLGLRNTTYSPLTHGIPAERCAPTEFDESYRHQLVRGEVHDENAHSLDGISANAGLFGTCADLLTFGDAVRTNATPGGPLLGDVTSLAMLTDQLPTALDPGFRHGLGWRLGDPGTAGPLAAGLPASHTGFTGTSLIVDRARGLVVAVLTNRVHPNRDWSDVTGMRQAVATYAASVVDSARETDGPSAAVGVGRPAGLAQVADAAQPVETSQAPSAARRGEVIQRMTARVIVRDLDGAVLLLRGHNIDRPDIRFWYTPGGGVEPGEDPRVAAARELREETGLDAEPAALVGPVHTDTADFVFAGRRYLQQQTYYLLDVPRFEPASAGMDEEEHASVVGFGWHAPQGGLVEGEQVYPEDLASLLTALGRVPLRG